MGGEKDDRALGLGGDRALQLGSLIEATNSLRASVDRLLDARDDDRRELSEHAEKIKTLFNRLKELADRIEATVVRLTPTAESAVVAERERMRRDQDEADFRREVRERLDRMGERLGSLEKTKEAVKTEAVGVGKLLLVGAGGGSVWAVVDALRRLLA